MTHDPAGRDARKRALEESYGAEVPDSTADRVIMVDRDAALVRPFVD